MPDGRQKQDWIRIVYIQGIEFYRTKMCSELGNNVYQCDGSCAAGTVWGTGIYTSDSNIYQAAKHMGYLPGIFTKIPGPGLPGYVGTNQNGVTTTSYGNYGSSYYLHKGNFNVGNKVQSTQITDSQLKALQNQVESLQNQVVTLTSTSQKLQNLIGTYEASLKQILQKIEQKQKDPSLLEPKVQSSKKTAVLQARLRDLYNSEMKRYNQMVVDILVKKETLLCSICCQQKRVALINPCGHANFCKDCAKNCLLKGKCGICSVEVTGYQFVKFQ